MTNEPCPDKTLLIQADYDGELSAAEAAALHAHLQTCPGCRAQAAFLQDLSARLRSEIPRTALPAWITTAAPPIARPATFAAANLWRYSPALSMLALVAVISLASLRTTNSLPDEAVAAHIRALQPGHLMDVVSTDRHTVKPWFAGKLDFSPPVHDFATAGFPLKGARLDYLVHRPVAAMVYGRDRHLIDLSIWPAATAAAASGTLNGYNYITWHQDGMAFCAVSDLNAAELQQFAELWQK
jgi:anti-sigma factor RsiW